MDVTSGLGNRNSLRVLISHGERQVLFFLKVDSLVHGLSLIQMLSDIDLWVDSGLVEVVAGRCQYTSWGRVSQVLILILLPFLILPIGHSETLPVNLARDRAGALLLGLL